MDHWEREQERIILRQKELEENARPLSDKQIRKNISRNWVEVIDDEGNKHYYPRTDRRFRSSHNHKHFFFTLFDRFFSFLVGLVIVILFIYCFFYT